MPIGWLYITYHLLREPETAIVFIIWNYIMCIPGFGPMKSIKCIKFMVPLPIRQLPKKRDSFVTRNTPVIGVSSEKVEVQMRLTTYNHKVWYIDRLGGFKYFFFHPYLGKIPILTNIFQRGWNHQLVGILCIHFQSLRLNSLLFLASVFILLTGNWVPTSEKGIPWEKYSWSILFSICSWSVGWYCWIFEKSDGTVELPNISVFHWNCLGRYPP